MQASIDEKLDIAFEAIMVLDKRVTQLENALKEPVSQSVEPSLILQDTEEDRPKPTVCW